ncbi:MAG: hypothetical protein MN733_19070 [Nitrososphaera sp.]|nr:hypothetical protein [Nitrososphaera sp.]
MQLTSPYSLPYDVFYDEGQLMSEGNDVRLKIALSTAATPDAIDALDSLVLPFFLLATSGALAGPDIPPWKSTIRDKDGPFTHDHIVEWVLRTCTVDAKSITVLAQTLLSVQDLSNVNTVTFSGLQTSSSIGKVAFGRSVIDAYPPAFHDPGFALARNSEVGREVFIRAIFTAPHTPEICEAVNTELFSWAAGVLSGAYGVAPIQPDQCTASVDDKVIYFKSELNWSLSRFTAHPAAFDGLINVFASVSRRIALVSELVIE